MSKSTDQNTWYVGGSFLKSKYVVYDMTPLDQNKKNYIQVGIGETNTSAIIGQKQYETDSIHYYPKPEAKDATTTMDGFEDPYVIHAQKQEEVKVVKAKTEKKKAEDQTWILILIFFILLLLVIGFVVMYYLKNKKQSTFDASKAVEDHNALIANGNMQSGIN